MEGKENIQNQGLDVGEDVLNDSGLEAEEVEAEAEKKGKLRSRIGVARLIIRKINSSSEGSVSLHSGQLFTEYIDQIVL